MASFEKEISKYLKNKSNIKDIKVSDIPKTSGIYIVELANNKKVEILETSSAIKEYTDSKGKTHNLLYSKKVLEDKLQYVDEKILYIGKAESKEGGLYERISLLIKYSLGNCKNHIGGRALWQIKDWENILNLYWYEVEESEKIEKYLLNLHSKEHPNKKKGLTYPFANWRN